jgi:undecaprenyl-diphosphatase
LKDIFKSPLPETAPSQNYAFPSGHMNFATMFYMWVIFQQKTRMPTKILIATILISTGWSMVYVGYHHPLDIIMTPIFPTIVLLIYYKFLKKISLEKQILMFSLSAIALLIISKLSFGYIKCDAIIGGYATIGFAASLSYLHYKKNLLIFWPIIIIAVIISDNTKIADSIIWSLIFFAVPILKNMVLYQKRFSIYATSEISEQQ